MSRVTTEKIPVSLESLQDALERADRNDNGRITDREDAPIVITHEGKDYFVPFHPDYSQLAQTLLGSHGEAAALIPDKYTSVSLAVVRNERIGLIDQSIIQDLMSLQGNNSLTLGALAVAFPKARFQQKGPTLKEIGETRLGDGTFLRDCFFLQNGALSLNHIGPFRDFLEQNAPSIAQLLTNNFNHPNPACHTVAAYTLTECQPDKLPATYEQLIAHAKVLFVDFGENSLPPEVVVKAEKVLSTLRQGCDQHRLSGVTFVGSRKVRIDVGRAELVREVLDYLHSACPQEASLACDPSDKAHIAFHSGFPIEGEHPTDVQLSVALFNVFDSITSSPLQYEFDKEEAEDPALFNAKIGRPSVMANISIPFSYLQEGIFDRAVFSYTLANAVSFLPRGNIDGSIYGTGVGRPFHQGDNEAIRGVVDWNSSGHLRRLEVYANEHGATPPLRRPYVATGYRSGAIAGLDDIPADEDGVYLARISGRGVISGGATAAIQLSISWQGRGMSAMEGGVTPDVIRLKKPVAALLVPGDETGHPVKTAHDPVPKGMGHLPRIVYHLVIQDPHGPHGFILGYGKHPPPGVLLSDDGGIIGAARKKIRQNRLGRNHVVHVGGAYAARSHAGRVDIGYAPHTEAAFGDWILSPYLFFPVRPRMIDWPRGNLHLLSGDELEGPQLHADLDLLHLGVGYAAFEGGRVMVEVDGGGTAALSFPSPDFHAGVLGKAAAALAFDIHDVATVRVGYDVRASTNEYPEKSGRHWEHFVGVVLEQRFNQSLYR